RVHVLPRARCLGAVQQRSANDFGFRTGLGPLREVAATIPRCHNSISNRGFSARDGGSCREVWAAVSEGVLWRCEMAGLKNGKRWPVPFLRQSKQTATPTFRRCILRARA